MKLSFLCTFVLQAFVLGAYAVDETEFWDYYSEVVDSLGSFPSRPPSSSPSATPSAEPTKSPSDAPSETPSVTPSATPSARPTPTGSFNPTPQPSADPSAEPSVDPSAAPSVTPSETPSAAPSATPSARPTPTDSFNPTPQPSADPSAEPSVNPSAAPSVAPSATPSAAPSVSPSAVPSATPSESPSAEPTPTDSFNPTPQPSADPSAEPSVDPSAAPSVSPSAAPSAEPSVDPSVAPSFSPSAAPSATPSAAPSAKPSGQPSEAPSESPSGACSIDTTLNCTTVIDGTVTGCENIVEETEPLCTCQECVRTLAFVYTGRDCSADELAAGACTDSQPKPFNAAYSVTNPLDATDVLASGEVQQGDEIKIDGLGDSGCIPDALDVVISTPGADEAQSFRINSSCDGGRGLILKEDYGAFESSGYSCSESDVHNCRQSISYGVEICNKGTDEEQIYDWFLKAKDEVNGEETFIDLLDNVNPEDVLLSPTDCFDDVQLFDVDRCSTSSYFVDITANATNPTTGLPEDCSVADEIQFGWQDLPPLPPTAAPSPSPTSTCVIDLNITGCPEFPPFINNNCDGRPQVIEFRYLGGDCSQSKHFQPRQTYNCEDSNGGPPPRSAKGTVNYIIATPNGSDEVYFEGAVAVGEPFILNEDKNFDKLSADMTVQIFSSQGGDLLQSTDVHLSCSQPLFLYDIFGSSQVIEWMETDGRVVSTKIGGVPTGSFLVGLDTFSDKPVRLKEFQIITSASETPINYTSQVNGIVIEPGGDPIELAGVPIDLDFGDLTTRRIRYTFFGTIIGETLDGTNECNGNSFLECEVGLPLDPVVPTDVPTPSPTATPYPTGAPNSTACEIESIVDCSIISPAINGLIACDSLTAPNNDTCPEDHSLYVAYLEYDGTLGPSIFVVPTCGKKNEFTARTVSDGAIFELDTRASDFCEEVEFEVWSADPLVADDAELFGSSVVALPCPGPWTIGSVIAPGLILKAYASTPDGGTTTFLNLVEAEVQIAYTGINIGNSPLTVNSGTFTAFDSEVITSTPVTIAQRSSEVLLSELQTIQLAGQSGQTLNFGMEILGSSANEFAIPCSSTSAYEINL